MIQNICFDNKLLAIIIRSHTYEDGIKFVTPNDFSQQIGCMSRPKGYAIEPHLHNSVAREVCYTKEVLFIKSGKVRVDFYSDEKAYIESYILNQGDVILLAFGGHGFEMLEDSEILEVKQGPYAGDSDKTRFSSIDPKQISIKQ
jgi:hypothetical protein